MSRFGEGTAGVAVKLTGPAPAVKEKRSASVRRSMMPLAVGVEPLRGVAVVMASPWASVR